MKIKLVVLSLYLVVSGLSSKALPDEITLNIPAPYVAVIEDAQGYAEFSGSDIQYLPQSGEPMIPYYVERVQLPSNADLTTVSVSIEAYGLEPIEGEWDVLPIPPIAYWNGMEMVREWPEGKTIVNEMDVDIYEKSNLFPANILHTVSTGQKRRQKLVEVPIALYQYNPVMKKLYQISEVSLRVKFSVKLTTFSDQFDIFDSRTSNESDKTYVIITTNTIKEGSSELANFVDHKEKRGFSVEVVTEDTWGGGIGDTATENIRDWLRANYLNLNIEYILLIGNPHPLLGDVPMKMLWSKTNDLTYNIEFPSDYYYADLTGNWDLDNDGFYGEWEDDFGSGGVDRYWEVIVGRIPFYGNLDDLDSILTKIINYEKASLADASWRKNMLFINKPLTERTPGYRVGEAIKEDIILSKEDWSYYRVYDQDYELTPPPETMPTTFESVANVWNSSNFGAVFWYGHGGPLIAYDIIDLSHTANLDNSHPAFTFQASCSTSYPEAENLSFYLLVNGCLSTIGATRVSYNLGLQTFFSGTTSNQGLLYEYAKRLIGDEMNCGHSLYDMKEKLIPSRSAFWANFLVYNIYGDPSTGLFTYVTPCYYNGGDADHDGVCSNFDNCLGIENPDQTDSDSDNVGNECDGCPYDSNKTEPGICGCGVADTDTDNDGIPDCNDGCDNDPNKTSPGICGCGVADTDTDSDGTPNCNDDCDNDPNKTSPGICGCGVADTDTDNDGTPDCMDDCDNRKDTDGDGINDCDDGCPGDPQKIISGICGCGVADTDTDNDGTPNCNDNCDDDPNKTEIGICGCGIADIDTDEDGTVDCNDSDDDNDGISDLIEDSGPNDGDSNNDGISDSLQNNLAYFEAYNAPGAVVLESSKGTLTNCQATENPSPNDTPVNIQFDYGFFDFTITDISAGNNVTLTFTLIDGKTPITYYKYGKTPDNQTNHWYEFLYDGQTGAMINGNVITLYFIDALRGDDILIQDSKVIDLGAPGFDIAADDGGDDDGGGGGSGGCSIDTLRY